MLFHHRKPVQRESLYLSRPGAPYKGAISTKPIDEPRFGMRDAVIKHKSLSDGAVRLYVLLDTLSGPKGESWGSQAFLVANLGGICTKELRNRIEELRGLGFVRTVRNQRNCRYILGWRPDGNKRSDHEILMGTPVPPDGNACSYEDPAFLTESRKESITPKCPNCGNLGRIGGEIGGEICDCAEGAAIRGRLRRRLRA